MEDKTIEKMEDKRVREYPCVVVNFGRCCSCVGRRRSTHAFDISNFPEDYYSFACAKFVNAC